MDGLLCILPSSYSMRMRSCLVLALLLVAVGCGSAEGAYTDGMELETAGEYARAAEAYALALERDRDLPNVAGRLAVAGREAISRAVAEAAGADPEGAAEAYLRADALVVRAGGVGVDLDRPATFEADRDAALARAVDAVYARAEAHVQARDFASAVRSLGDARRFRPSPARQSDLDALARGAYRDWAEDDLADGRYRDALGHADAALALGESDALLDLRAEILYQGTIVVAVLPPEGNDDELFLRDLGDAIVEDHLAPPPALVVLVDPAEVRRWERTQRGRRGPDLADSPRRLGEAADDLGADLGAVVAVGPIDEQTTRGRESAETAAVRGSSARATFYVREDELQLSATADVVAAAPNGRVACDETVRREVEVEVDRARYDGDWRDLDLSRADRRRFADDAVERARVEAMGRLRDALASALADRISACAGRLVP